MRINYPIAPSASSLLRLGLLQFFSPADRVGSPLANAVNLDGAIVALPPVARQFVGKRAVRRDRVIRRIARRD
jgi:hypothetical protein